MLKRRRTAIGAGLLAAVVPLSIGVASLLNDDSGHDSPAVATPSPSKSSDSQQIAELRRVGRKVEELRRQVQLLTAQRRKFERRIQRQVGGPGTNGWRNRPLDEVETTLDQIRRELVRTLAAQRRRQDICRRLPLPFKATYLPEGFEPSLLPGGIRDGFSRKTDYPDSIAYYFADEGTYIEVLTGGSPWGPTDPSPIEIGGRAAQIGGIEGGDSIAFRWSGCDYVLMTFSVSRDELKKVAEGFVVRR